MDHLPYPKDPVLPPIQVPYLCQDVEQYDGLGFESFPIRAGWTRKDAEGSTIHWYNCADHIAARRAQSWLYFGLLREFLVDKYIQQYFIRYDIHTQQLVICSSRLSILGHAWSLQHSGFARQSFLLSSTRYTPYMRMLIHLLRRHASSTVTCILLSKLEPPLDVRLPQCLEIAENLIQFLDPSTTIPSLIALSIRVALWSIKNVITNCEPCDARQHKDRSLPGVQLLRQQLEAGGICLYWANTYLERHSVAMVNYVAALPKITRASDHRICTSERCKANDMDKSTYQTKHAVDSCHCDFIGVDLPAIIHLIEKDQTPILRLTQSSEGAIALEVCRADFDVNYTAISHVWSGGLGNKGLNALPLCQLQKIRHQLLLCQAKARKNKSIWNEEAWFPKFWARYRQRNPMLLGSWLAPLLRYGSRHKQSEDSLMFWMDTLCIPVGHGQDHLKRKAITKMDFIYSGADSVLVLDPDTQDLVASDTSALQRSVHMMLSCWMTRCWTYQEARLARDWFFAFTSYLHEPLLDYRRLEDVEQCIKMHLVNWNDERQLQLEASSFVDRLWPITDKRPNDKTHDDLFEFVQIWQELAERSTSRKSDLHAIFAILLGLNPKEILELEHPEQPELSKDDMRKLHYQERMKAILRTQPCLPLSFLFVPSDVPKSDGHKNRWMPRFPAGPVTSEFGCMKLTTEGKFYRLSTSKGTSAFLVQQDTLHTQPVDIREDDSSPIYTVSVQISAKSRHRNLEPSGPIWVLYVLHDYDTQKLRVTRKCNVGARFVVVEAAEANSYRLLFDSSVTYATLKEDHSSSKIPTQLEPGVLAGRRLHTDSMLLLDCGE